MKKVAAIHDLSGYGRASLTVVIPVLSCMGYQVCPLPTAVLSAHSEFAGFRSLDLTGFMSEAIAHWKSLGLSFDAIYSGYLASERQMEVVEGFFRDFGNERNFIVVDPVLGDHGALYPGMTAGMVAGMRRLCARAGVITPNLTEAALLLGRDPRADIPAGEAARWCEELCATGPERVIITSAPGVNGRDATLARDGKEGRTWRVTCEHVPASYPGTGDAFASAITGCLLNGDTLPEAIDRAVYFVHAGIKATFGHAGHPLDGIDQERVLHYLNAPLPCYSYELI
ncbi:MAG: pyridoxamine kinase [Odoribacteraceae bacterium]|jgi:pyridoxine kinase|nr:pyridoxamine kinase [Odoribacteraceae bacterium]